MNRLIICDFDGCLVQEGKESIKPNIATRLKKLNEQFSVVIVSARATEKSKNELRKMLKESGLEQLPVYLRNTAQFDHSPEGLTQYKTHVLKGLQNEKNMLFAAIGDNKSDDLAYIQSGVKHIFRILWQRENQINPNVFPLNATEENLTDIWGEIQTMIERKMKNGHE